MDTGAATSCISEGIRRRLHAVLTPARAHFLRLGNGAICQSLGCATLSVLIAGTRYVILFTVLPDCAADVILRLDFLASTDALIDCASRELHLNSFDPSVELAEHPAVNLRAVQDVFLPPLSVIFAALTTDQKFPGTSGLLEPSLSLFTKKGIAVPFSIVTIRQDKVHLYITNASRQQQIIPLGSHIATLRMFQEDNIASLSNGVSHSPSRLPSTQDPSHRIRNMIDPDLPDEQQKALTHLLGTYETLFDFQINTLPTTTFVRHTIDTADAPPVKSRPYRVSPAERAVIEQHVTDMLQKKVIEHSSSPWSSPVVLVKKQDGSWRFCVDYQRLNSVTRKDAYPLPRIDDTLDALQGSCFFSSMDLRSGYWQIPVANADKPKTAFITPSGLYHFNVMPFGLCNAPATFERMMDTLLRGLTWNVCLCYLDDIVVFSTTFDEHLHRL